MGAFLVDDVRSMTALIRAGKQLNIKSFAVIPLSEVESTPPTSVDRSAGIVGPLSGVLKADKRYSGLLNFIGGDTVLVESEAIAYVLASEGFRTVTPEGEIFEMGGRAFAFGIHDAVAIILQGIEDIEDIGEVESAVAALRAAIERRRQLLTSVEGESRVLGKDRVKKIATVAALKAEVETVSRLSKRYRTIFHGQRQERDNQQKVVDRLSKRQVTLQARKESMLSETASLKATLQQADSLELEKMINELESTRRDLAIQVNEISSRLSDVHLSSHA